MKALTICGSLRDSSSNRFLLDWIQNYFPTGTVWNHFEIRELPYFDPELQFSENLPAVVRNFRLLAAQADLILISTPEYAHGIPGILKNALEWLLCEETMKKKVALLIGTSSGGEYVQSYLLETLTTMDLMASEDWTLVVRNARALAQKKISEDPIFQAQVRKFVDGFLRSVPFN